MKQLPTVICVDVEPDARHPDFNAGSNWTGFEESLRLVEELRCRSGIDAIFCWFLRMDPQVEIVHGSAQWVVERYGKQIDNLRNTGDEIGLHTHAWRHVSGQWITDNGDQQWVDQCVRVSFEAYESAFGGGCRSFRFGDHWMNNDTFDLLESLGAQYNLTVEPGLRSRGPGAGLVPPELWTGRFPDYAKVPREPYKPTRKDFRKTGETRDEREMWVIPVSTTLLPQWPAAPFYRRVIWRTRYGRRLYYPLSLALDPDQFRHSLDDVVEGKNGRHLCVVVRTGSILQLGARVRENLKLLLSQAADGRLQLMTPAGLVAATTGLTTS